MPVVAQIVPVLACLFCVAAIYTALASRWLERRHPPSGEFIDVQGTRLHYLSRGRGRPIVLLHGASSSLRDFQASIFDDLARDHHVIAFDRPGYGYSDRPTGDWCDPDRQAALIRQALQDLGIQDPLIVGHSWSGALILAYMLRFPGQASGGVLLAGVANTWDTGVSWYYSLAGWRWIGRLLSATLLMPFGQLYTPLAISSVFAPARPTPGYRRRIAADLALRPGAFHACAEDVRKLEGFMRSQITQHGRITSPILLLTAEHDTIVPAWNHAAVLAQRILHARHVELPGIGHALHHSRPDEVAHLIRDFLREQPEDGAVGLQD